MVTAPIFRMARVREITCWNHDRDDHTLYGLTSLTAIFNRAVNENDFSVAVKRHRFLQSHDIKLRTSFHCHHKCNYEKLERVIVIITWGGDANMGRKTISGLNREVSKPYDYGYDYV